MTIKTVDQHNAAVDAYNMFFDVFNRLSAPEDHNAPNILADYPNPLSDARESAANAMRDLKKYIDLPIDGIPSVSDVLFGKVEPEARASVKSIKV